MMNPFTILNPLMNAVLTNVRRVAIMRLSDARRPLAASSVQPQSYECRLDPPP